MIDDEDDDTFEALVLERRNFNYLVMASNDTSSAKSMSVKTSPHRSCYYTRNKNTSMSPIPVEIVGGMVHCASSQQTIHRVAQKVSDFFTK